MRFSLVRWCAIALLGWCLAVLPVQLAQSVPLPSPAEEIRGVWLTNIDSDVLFSRDRLRNALQQLADLNFNTIYPTVWNWGYTLYPSAVAQREIGLSLDPTPGLQGRDLLAEAVQEGHQRNLTVIPWFEFGFMAPADSALAKRHPDWLTQRQDGSQTWMEGVHPRVWLNPFHPQAQQFLLDLIGEIVSRYDVDGIQFDDHLGLPVAFGYDPFTVKLYQQEHNGQSPPADPKDLEWVRWRADKITRFVERAFQLVKRQKPTCIFALAPNSHPFAYANYLQDWKTWEQRGLIEELILQVYRNNLQFFAAELIRDEMQVARKRIPVGVGILSGLKNRTVPINLVQYQVQVTRGLGFPGVSFFFYETLWNLTTEASPDRQAAFRELFATPARHPKLGKNWKPPVTSA